MANIIMLFFCGIMTLIWSWVWLLYKNKDKVISFISAIMVGFNITCVIFFIIIICKDF